MRRLTRRQRRAAVALALVAVLFATADLAGAPFADARGGVQGFFGALYRGTDSVLGPARRFVAAVPRARSNAAEVARLRRELAGRAAASSAAAADARTSAALARLRLQATRGGYSVLPARVTAIGAGVGFDWTVTLDAGSGDGVRTGQTVITGPELVGRVVRVSATSATVLLAVDPGSGVGVRDERSGELGLVTGRGTAGYRFAPLSPAAAPRAGDVLLSGPARASTYVAGLTVGTITAVHPGSDGGPTADVAPAVSATALDLVGVVLVGGAPGARPPLKPGTSAGGRR